MDLNKKQPIVEVYPCLQSEGSLAGIPHFCIRTTGCTLRCQFSKTDFCDSWYTSWKPEKGSFSINEVFSELEEYPHIKHVFITGGSPTMHPELLRALCNNLHDTGYMITLETEGSRFVDDCWIDLLSLSPKMRNSMPRVGTQGPHGREVSQKDLDRHNKNRANYDVMKQWIASAQDYQYKPVMSDTSEAVEIFDLADKLNIPNSKIWIMPAGGSEEELQLRRVEIMEYCWKAGVNYTDRYHITAYGTKRGV